MSGWGELIKQGVKSATKAMVKKGSTVSTKKIDDGVVKFVEPYSKKVTVQSKDGKITETVKSEEVRVKKVKTRTRDKSVYIADEADAVALKDLPDDVKLNMSEGELLQRIIRSGESGSGAARRLFPTDSAGDKRGRFIAYSKTKIKPDLEERAYKKNIFAREKELAEQEVAKKQQVKELEEKKVTQKKQQDAEYIKKRRQAPQANDPLFRGDLQKFLAARRRYEENSVKPALKNDPNATYWNRGGSVNTKRKQYRTVTNRFSNRMLPNKKRTTRIY
jgi:hypothetical protein|tara:strand:+ start:520 stop:1347 length:828 start_codon:yes stop_codon:yes gene_type:complete